MDILSWVLASCALDSVGRAWACRSVDDDARTHMYEEKNDDEKRNKDTHNDVDAFVITSTFYAKRSTWEHANAGTKSRRPNQKQT